MWMSSARWRHTSWACLDASLWSQRVPQNAVPVMVMLGSRWQHAGPIWIDSSPGMPPFNPVTLFSIAIRHAFCCTAHGWLPCNCLQLYMLAMNAMSRFHIYNPDIFLCCSVCTEAFSTWELMSRTLYILSDCDSRSKPSDSQWVRNGVPQLHWLPAGDTWGELAPALWAGLLIWRQRCWLCDGVWSSVQWSHRNHGWSQHVRWLTVCIFIVACFSNMSNKVFSISQVNMFH